MHIERARKILLGAILALASCGRALAEGQAPPGGEVLDTTGTLASAQSSGVEMKSASGELWFIMINRDTKVRVTGSAEPEFLRPGVAISFSGETDKKGVLKADLQDLEVYTPSKSDYGVFAAELDEKPVRVLEDGKRYFIRGRVHTNKGGTITIKAGTKNISGKLAAAPTIKVNASDINLAQQDDNLKVSGWYFTVHKAGPNKPGKATGTDLDITLARPLSGPKKAVKPTKQARAPARSGGFGKLPPTQDRFAPENK